MNNEKDTHISANAGQTPPSSAETETAQEQSATFQIAIESSGNGEPQTAVSDVQYEAVPGTPAPAAQEEPEPPVQVALPEETQEIQETPEQETPAQEAQESPAQEESAQETQASEETAAPQPAAPVPARRRQHYFTNLPNIGLEAEPLTAPWETDHPQDDAADGEDEEKAARSDRIATVVAVIASVVIAVVVLGFIAVMLMTNADSGKQAIPAKQASDASLTASTLPTAAAQTQIGDPNKTVVMPNLNGLKEAEAYRRLNAAEVRFRVVRVNDDEVPFNYIVSQNPAPGQEFAATEEAVIYLSKGKENERIESSKHIAVSRPTNPTTAATSATGAASATGAVSADYILPNSASKQLTKSDLTGLNRETLNLALNEIYARHGRKFTDTAISDYFNGKSWYRPTIAAADFDEGILNQYELYNVKLITTYQSEMGYR